jgi:signal transduction histidine kinase
MSLKLPRHVHKTISFRLAVWSSFVFILSSLTLFGLAYFLISSSLQEKDRADVQLKLKKYSDEYQSGGLAAVKRWVESEASSGLLRAFVIRVGSPKNQTMFLKGPLDGTVYDFKKLEYSDTDGSGTWVRLHAEGEDDVLDIASLRLADGSVLQVGKGPEDREDALDRFRNIFALVLIAIVALGLVGGTIFARQALRPVRGLISALGSIIATGKISSRVPVHQTGDELEELSILFNQALAKIDSLITGMRGSLDNVAHDLRTPMTRLRGIAEVALQSSPDLGTYREALADCMEESEQVLTTLNTLMDISEVEAGSVKLDLQEVNILALINQVRELYRCIAEDKAITVSTICPEDLSLMGDRNRLLQVLANLLDNAIKYTEAGGRVSVEADHQDNEVSIIVRDTGIGIPPEDLGKVWDRFYRGDKSRTQRGLGLGLSLVKATIQAHQGKVEVSSEPGRGSRFTIHLPVTYVNCSTLVPPSLNLSKM